MTSRENLSYAFAESDSYATKTHFLRSQTTANHTKYFSYMLSDKLQRFLNEINSENNKFKVISYMLSDEV